ncbi:MAG: hypothetical protein KF820_02400 [Candidatus Paracaedibacteraceae bacterium]|nr:hypothetical protein [Candidatus Paracaedibacteraceae bacterium]
MSKIVSPKIVLIGFFLWVNPSFSAELFATMAGAALSSGASGYVKEVVATTGDHLVEAPKTFDNEYNEAVCSFDLENMRSCVNSSLAEIDGHARQSSQILNDSQAQHVNNSVFIALAKSAIQMTLRYELALISIDFIKACKKMIFEAIDGLQESKKRQFNPRVLGEEQASQLEKGRDERVSKALRVLGVWKNNLLAALHEKYPYLCEGGVKDRYVRSTARHKKRSKEWRIEADWLGYVSVPKIDLEKSNPFDSEDLSAESRAVSGIEKTYDYVFSFIRLPFHQQIGGDGVGYINAAREKFAELFPSAAMTPVSYDVPEILVAYRQYLSHQHGQGDGKIATGQEE